MASTLPFARAPQSFCFLANLTHSSEDVGGITVHQDNSHLVSGELSHRKALSVAEFLGQECPARAPQASARHCTTQPGTHLQDALLGHAQCTALESRGLVGLVSNPWPHLQGCAGTVLRPGWWTNTSPMCVPNLMAGPQGCVWSTPADGPPEKGSGTRKSLCW